MMRKRRAPSFAAPFVALLCAALGIALCGGGFLLFLRQFGLDLEASLQTPAGKRAGRRMALSVRLLFQPLTICHATSARFSMHC